MMRLGQKPKLPEMEYNRAGFDTITFIPANQIHKLCQLLLQKNNDNGEIYYGCTYQYPMDIQKIINGDKFYRGPSQTLLSKQWAKNGLHKILAHENDYQKIRSLIQWIQLDLERRTLPQSVTKETLPYFTKQLEDIDDILDADDYIDNSTKNKPQIIRFANIDHLLTKSFEEYINYITEQEKNGKNILVFNYSTPFRRMS